MKNQRQFLSDFVARIFATNGKSDIDDYFRAVFVHFDARTKQVYLDFYKTDQLQDLPALLAKAIIDADKRLEAQAENTSRPYYKRMQEFNQRYSRRFIPMSEYFRNYSI